MVLMLSELPILLESRYGIIAKSIAPTKGGFSSKAAYCVVGADGAEYFVKVYDKSLPTTMFNVNRVDLYMPVLDWLSKTTPLRGCVLTPISTQEGVYKVETDNDVYVAFLFVHGEPPGIQGMTRAQTVELAGILASLHDISETIPFNTQGLAEDVSLPFCDRLIQYINDVSGVNGKDGALSAVVSPHASLLLAASSEALQLRDAYRMGYAPIVLCHGDAHGNNVIQSDHLVLADWEDLRWAPAEADLFIYDWHPYGDVLLDAYAEARHGYRINNKLLYFYVLRRRIEDVWVDIQRLTEESPDETETAKLLDYVRRGIESVREAYRG